CGSGSGSTHVYPELLERKTMRNKAVYERSIMKSALK
ncbi:hypothetical protein A2U01_0025284, partial [Trifolium medium]|nr:hypothetical protein [Trifolium medium]